MGTLWRTYRTQQRHMGTHSDGRDHEKGDRVGCSEHRDRWVGDREEDMQWGTE